MSTTRFLHEHERDPVEVERLVVFAIAQAVRVPPLAIRVLAPGRRDYPTGVAYLTHWPDWSRKLYPQRASKIRQSMFAITVRTVTDHADCLGELRVCWHATAARAAYRDAPDSVEYQPEVVAAYARGERKYGSWPIYVTHDWREAFLHTFAHELSHVLQWERGGRRSEVQCETFAVRVLEAWRQA
jgi:hypothetical protein